MLKIKALAFGIEGDENGSNAAQLWRNVAKAFIARLKSRS